MAGGSKVQGRHAPLAVSGDRAARDSLRVLSIYAVRGVLRSPAVASCQRSRDLNLPRVALVLPPLQKGSRKISGMSSSESYGVNYLEMRQLPSIDYRVTKP